MVRFLSPGKSGRDLSTKLAHSNIRGRQLISSRVTTFKTLNISLWCLSKMTTWSMFFIIRSRTSPTDVLASFTIFLLSWREGVLSKSGLSSVFQLLCMHTVNSLHNMCPPLLATVPLFCHNLSLPDRLPHLRKTNTIHIFHCDLVPSDILMGHSTFCLAGEKANYFLLAKLPLPVPKATACWIVRRRKFSPIGYHLGFLK